MMTTEPKLYRVTIECEVWVIATSREDAESINHASDWRDLLRNDVYYNASTLAIEVTQAEDASLPWRARGAEGAEDAPVSEWAARTREAIKRAKFEADDSRGCAACDDEGTTTCGACKGTKVTVYYDSEEGDE